MEISYFTIPGNLRKDTGYGYAGYNIVRSLQQLGHTVPYSDRNCEIQICFSQPDWYTWYRGQYRIGYTPWESTQLPPGWLDKFNDCDEVWATSPWVAQVYKDCGVEKDIHVYPHGINPIFAPKPRVRREKLKFLHLGEPAPRKAGQMALDAFREAFGDQDDVQLTIKAFLENRTRAMQNGTIIGPADVFNNVKLSVGSVSTEELVALYHNHHALVYPSYGEGFGFIPLEAMATGMPAMVTQGWAVYEKHVLPVRSKLIDSPWPHIHPGQVFEPDYDSLVRWYRKVYDDYESLASRAYARSHMIHREYNWLQLTEKAFKHLAENSLKV